MLKRVLDGLLKKKNRQNFKIGTTDGYYYQIESDRLINLPRLSFSFTETILAYTQKHNAFEHQHLVTFLKQLAADGFSARSIKQYMVKNFAFEPWATLNTAQDRMLEGNFDPQQNKFFLKKPSKLFKYQFLFSVASLFYHCAQQMNASQLAEFDKRLNHNLDNNPLLLVKAG